VTPVIEAIDLCKTYEAGVFSSQSVEALKKVNFSINAGEIFGYLGPNGSGKTTLLRVLGGLLRPATGRAQVLGCDPAERSLVTRVGYQPEGAMPFPTLSGLEFLQYMGDMMRLPKTMTRDAAPRWLGRLGLGKTGKKAIRNYSTGMCRRLALAVALLADPEVLLLDEPTSGLDPVGSLLVMEILRECAKAGTAVLLASHHLQEVEQICGRIYLLGNGKVISAGSLDDLLGTGELNLVVRNLDDSGLAAVEAVVQESGGEIVRRGKEREHLFALFRRVQDSDRDPS